MGRDIASPPAKNSRGNLRCSTQMPKFSLPLTIPPSLLHRSIGHPSFSIRARLIHPVSSLYLSLRTLFYLFPCIFLCTIESLIPLFVLSVSCFLIIISLPSSATLLSHPSFTLSFSLPLVFLIFCHTYVLTHTRRLVSLLRWYKDRLDGQYRTS